MIVVDKENIINYYMLYMKMKRRCVLVRKIWIILLVLVLAFVLVGCGKVAENNAPSEQDETKSTRRTK